MIWRAALLPLAMAATLAPPASTAQQGPSCKVGKVIVAECLEALREAEDYTDEFMRGAAVRRAAEAMADERLRQAQHKCKTAGMTLGTATLGMTATTVEQCGWGPPVARRRRTDANGVTEVWLYDEARRLTLRGGKVVLVEE